MSHISFIFKFKQLSFLVSISVWSDRSLIELQQFCKYAWIWTKVVTYKTNEKWNSIALSCISYDSSIFSIPACFNCGSTASWPLWSVLAMVFPLWRSSITLLAVSNPSFIVDTITPIGPRFTHPLQYMPEKKSNRSSLWGKCSMDWASHIRGHTWTGQRRSLDWAAETHGDPWTGLWTPLDWAAEACRDPWTDPCLATIIDLVNPVNIIWRFCCTVNLFHFVITVGRTQIWPGRRWHDCLITYLITSPLCNS